MGTQEKISKLSLMGSNVVDALTVRKTEVIHARAIRNANANVAKTVPVGARGFLWTVRVYAVTGTTPSLVLSNWTGYALAKCPLSVSVSAITTAQTNVGVFWYPGAALGEGSKGNALNKIVAAPIASYLEFNAAITGTFAGGEGFDMESEVTWYF